MEYYPSSLFQAVTNDTHHTAHRLPSPLSPYWLSFSHLIDLIPPLYLLYLNIASYCTWYLICFSTPNNNSDGSIRQGHWSAHDETVRISICHLFLGLKTNQVSFLLLINSRGMFWLSSCAVFFFAARILMDGWVVSFRVYSDASFCYVKKGRVGRGGGLFCDPFGFGVMD